jgi:hypothetical protein
MAGCRAITPQAALVESVDVVQAAGLPEVRAVE